MLEQVETALNKEDYRLDLAGYFLVGVFYRELEECANRGANSPLGTFDCSFVIIAVFIQIAFAGFGRHLTCPSRMMSLGSTLEPKGGLVMMMSKRPSKMPLTLRKPLW